MKKKKNKKKIWAKGEKNSTVSKVTIFGMKKMLSHRNLRHSKKNSKHFPLKNVLTHHF
jgi:hypothetical protein